jgi:hypothetical protein
LLIDLNINNDETACREEVRDLAEWCQVKNLSLNVNKMKKLVVDYRSLGRSGEG